MKSIAIAYNPFLARLSAILAGAIALSALLYGVFLLEAVAHTAARTAAERHVRDTVARISALEGEYLARTRTLTPAFAQELGFVAPVRVTTVFAGAEPGSLSAASGFGSGASGSR